jgi:two-component system phosphate regulon response regulator PhoB
LPLRPSRPLQLAAKVLSRPLKAALSADSAPLGGTLRTIVSDRSGVRILVVDDDVELQVLLKLVLEGEGYEVSGASDSASALQQIGEGRTDLVVLDVGLGHDDGRVVLGEIRKRGDLPVILISGQGDTADRVLGLRLGADDFVPKPFSPVELVARVESILRRVGRNAAVTAPPATHVGLSIDERAREVTVDGRPVELTAKEFDLLAFLAGSPRQVFSRGQLLEHVWQSNAGWQNEATVTEHVRRVRYKMEPDPERPRWITTVRGVGYRFEP